MMLVHLQETDSTNTWLKLNRKSLSDGDAVTALRQTAGRGRIGHSWLDSEGMLPVSVLLRNPPYPETRTLTVSIAVCSALDSLYDVPPSFGIKWPNDIVLDGYKLCGILCESASDGDGIDIICGIGLDLCQSAEFFSEAGLPHAGSLLQLTGISPDREQTAQLIAEKVMEYSRYSFSELIGEYKSRCVTLGREVRLIRNGGEQTAYAEDIAESGHLICRNEDGRFEVSSGEVSVRGLYGYI